MPRTFLFVAAGLLLAQPAFAADKAKPNFLVIFADDK